MVSVLHARLFGIWRTRQEKLTVNNPNQINIQRRQIRLSRSLPFFRFLDFNQLPFLCYACIGKHDINPALFHIHLLKCIRLTLP